MSGVNEPVTLNLTEDAMALMWGVVEEMVRLNDMHAGARSSSVVGRGGRGSGDDSDDDDGSEDEVS